LRAAETTVPAATASLDRTLAEWALGTNRGTAEYVGVAVSVDGQAATKITSIAELPSGEFQLVSVTVNQLDDDDLRRLIGLKHLKSLSIVSRRISPAAVADLREMPELRFLALRGANLSATYFDALAHLQQVESLEMHNAVPTAAQLATLKSMSRLRKLTIRYIGASLDDAMVGVRQLTQLQSLQLWDAQISDAGLEHLHSLQNLTTLSVRQAGVTQAGLDRLQQALPKCRIITSQNQAPPEDDASPP
jgi:hypothetical protein